MSTYRMCFWHQWNSMKYWIWSMLYYHFWLFLLIQQLLKHILYLNGISIMYKICKIHQKLHTLEMVYSMPIQYAHNIDRYHWRPWQIILQSVVHHFFFSCSLNPIVLIIKILKLQDNPKRYQCTNRERQYKVNQDRVNTLMVNHEL